MRCFLLYHTAFQLERYHLIVAQLPHLATALPLPTRLLHLFAHLHLGKADTHPYTRGRRKTWRWRLPLAFCNNQLHRLEPLLPLRVVAIAHTDQTVTLLRA